MINIQIPVPSISIDVSSWYVEKWRNDISLYNACAAVLSDIPDRYPGVYFLYDKDDVLLYVGRSINVRRRVSEHLVKSSAGIGESAQLVTTVRCIHAENYFDQVIYEAYAIKTLKPLLNRVKLTSGRVVNV